jgi:hypothetical protein
MKITLHCQHFPCIFFLLFTCLLPFGVKAQCEYTKKITHLTGTKQVDCTSVTVTTEGSVGSLQWCQATPYWIGVNATGSYIFHFSPAISGVKINFDALNNRPSAGYAEELSFEINGSFYPITTPGIHNPACGSDAFITPAGTIGGCVDCDASAWNDLIIVESISSLKIENIHVLGSAAGTLVDLFICCPPCQTEAGEIVSGPLTFCLDNNAEVPPATQTFLDNDDLLQYIIFTNPNNPLGSILATSTDPSFPFDPAVFQTGVYYYIAAIAGNDLNGNVDLNDYCLDISNSIRVIWWPVPTLSFNATNPDICPGSCQFLAIDFSGTPPFLLNYYTPGGYSTVSFSSMTGTLEICVPAGTPEGEWEVHPVSLTDAHCTCN